MEIKDKLKAARAVKKITQKELAGLVGVTQATITKIETGETKNPSVDIALKIAQALGEDVYRLFSYESTNKTFLNISLNQSDYIIDLKQKVFHAIENTESFLILMKSFEHNENDNIDDEKFQCFRDAISTFKKNLYGVLITNGVCSKEEITEFFKKIDPNNNIP